MNWYAVFLFWMLIGVIAAFAAYLFGVAYACHKIEVRYGHSWALAFFFAAVLIPFSLAMGLLP
jgi:hypothetical protein